MDNLDDLGFEPSPRTHKKMFYVTSPEKFDGSSGRTYILGEDKLKRRVQELDKNNISKYAKVPQFRNIGLTPPKSACRRPKTSPSTNNADTVESTELPVADAANTSTDDPKPRSRGVYVPVVDPYMMGSTDYAEAIKFLAQVVCGQKMEDGSICGSTLHDLRVPNRGSGGELCFKCCCSKCGKEFRWGKDVTPPRGKDGKFVSERKGRFCSPGDRLMYSVRTYCIDVLSYMHCIVVSTYCRICWQDVACMKNMRDERMQPASLYTLKANSAKV